MGKDQASPTPENSLDHSDPFDGTNTSLPTRGTIQDFYHRICSWYQSQFEHYLAYNLGIKLWLQKGKVTVWHRLVMMFFRLWRKLVKLKNFFLRNCKTSSSCICNYKQQVCLKACLGKSLKLTLSMSLKYTAHFAWDLSLGQIRTSKKGGGGVKEIFQLSRGNYEISVCLSVWIYVCHSVCLLFCFLIILPKW